MLLFVYTTTRKSFVIFACRYFKLSWNTTAVSQSNCRNFSCSSIIIIIIIIIIIFYLLLSRPFGNFVCRSRELFPFAERCLVVNLRLCSPTRKVIWYTAVWTATARNWKKGFQHTHRASCRSGWPRGFGNSIPALTPEYLLPFQWFPVLTPTYSLLWPSEEVFTLHQSMAERVFQSLHHHSLLGWFPACTSNSKLLNGLRLVCSFLE